MQAIALDCIQLLCEADVLEFYAAWRVVHRALPRLPEHAGAAAAWVRFCFVGAERRLWLEAGCLGCRPAGAVCGHQWPCLPASLLAPQVRLLGSGGLDAAVQPDAAAAIVDALWLAAGHDEPQVRV